MSASLPVLDRSGVRLHECPVADLVPVRHPDLLERSGVAGAPVGQPGSELYEVRQLLAGGSGLAAGANACWISRVRFAWHPELQRIARRIFPTFQEVFGDYPVEYYWTVYQSEWATDVVFRSSRTLAALYPRLVEAGIGTFASPDVMRFLGKKLHGNFAGEVVSDYRRRREGIRVKHRMAANSIKMYDKHGRSLRVETTINDPSPFKILRTAQGNPDGVPSRRPMRRGISDLASRAQLSQAANERYLEALASLRGATPPAPPDRPHLSPHAMAGAPPARAATLVTGRSPAAANDQRWRVRPQRVA